VFGTGPLSPVAKAAGVNVFSYAVHRPALTSKASSTTRMAAATWTSLDLRLLRGIVVLVSVINPHELIARRRRSRR
jgi:hypothetical protein